MRIERAILILPADVEASGSLIDSVILSRLLIALNTVTTGLHQAAQADGVEKQRALCSAADLLWSVGERIGNVAPKLLMADAGRGLAP
jgi:hypothetical protein